MNRAERRRRTRIVVNRRKIFVDGYQGILVYLGDESKYDRSLKKLLGRSKKLHPLDCGISQCPICSCRFGQSRQERGNNISFKEQIKEQNSGD